MINTRQLRVRGTRLVYGPRLRLTEFRLLLLPAAFMFVGFLELLIALPLVQGNATPTIITQKTLPPLDAFLPAFGLVAALYGTHVLITLIAPDADQTLLPIAAMLSSISVLMSIRLGPFIREGPSLGFKQLAWVIIGLAACVATVFITQNLGWLRKYTYTWMVAAIILIGITLAHAHSFSTSAPSRDVLTIGSGGFSFQPSELLKICLVVFFAGYLSQNREMLAEGGYRIGPFTLPPLKQLGPLLVMLGIALLFFIFVRELGLAILILGIFLSLLYVASDRPVYVIGTVVLFAVGAFVAYQIFPYARTRIGIVGQGAFNDPTGSGYQIVQGLLALGSGGIFGDGLGLGHPYVIPAASTDFITASFGEEFGFAGILALIGIFMLLVYRGMHVAAHNREAFNQLLAVGLTTIFALQTIVIIAGNLSIMPLTGVPLPFVAYGGSSTIANYIIIGLLIRLSQRAT